MAVAKEPKSLAPADTAWIGRGCTTETGCHHMLLILDISNGRTSVALAGSHQQPGNGRVWRFSSDSRRTSDELGLQLDGLLRRANLATNALTGAVIGSVVPNLTSAWADACRHFAGLDPLVVGPGIRTGVKLRTDDPREVGADRIANALAVYRGYGGPAIVVDFSTAITFDAVSAEGDYLGSVITPGIGMTLAALAAGTSRLRSIELRQPRQVIGTSSAAAVQSGIVFGFGALVDGVVNRIRGELVGEPRVIATGSEADLVLAQAGTIEQVDPHLTLDGLRMIWELNQRGRSRAGEAEGQTS